MKDEQQSQKASQETRNVVITSPLHRNIFYQHETVSREIMIKQVIQLSNILLFPVVCPHDLCLGIFSKFLGVVWLSATRMLLWQLMAILFCGDLFILIYSKV